MGASLNEKEQARLIRCAENIIESVTAEKPKRLSGSTDCNIPLSKGIPAICFGLAMIGGTHTREEYIEIKSITLGLQVALLFVSNYLKYNL